MTNTEESGFSKLRTRVSTFVSEHKKAIGVTCFGIFCIALIVALVLLVPSSKSQVLRAYNSFRKVAA